MKFILCSFISVVFSVSFYSLVVPSLGADYIRMENYQDKKILIVNIAGESPQAGQVAQLQQLYNQHHDSLEIIAFPSNSFGNESRTNAQLKLWKDTSGISFQVAAKSDVRGNEMNPVYTWLSSKMQNDVMNGVVKSDFQKFLLDKSGKIVAVYGGSVSPVSQVMQDAIARY